MNTNILTFRTIIEKDGKFYHGFVPSLPGCHTAGKTIEETKKHLRETIIGYLHSLEKHGEPIPKEERLENIETIDLTKIFPQKKNFNYA